jgi:hypothetical protein
LAIGIRPLVRFVLPSAGDFDPAHDVIKQTVLQLLSGIDDGERASAVIAAVVAHHAPELTTWAQERLRHRFGKCSLHTTYAVSSPEASYKAIFGTAPVILPDSEKQASECDLEPLEGFLVDPEMARLAIVFDLAAPLRLWVFGRALSRRIDGAGWVSKQALYSGLIEHGYSHTPRHFRRLLAAGEGVFWNLSERKVFLRSWKHVAGQFSLRAQETRQGRIERNRPGVRQVYVPIDGSLQQWEAHLYAAWHAYRENPTISRSELSCLFGRDVTTLRDWEKKRLAGVLRVRKNYAQCPDWETFYNLIPHHAIDYVAGVRFRGRIRRVVRYRWQVPNTYCSSLKQHHRRGQASKVRRRVNVSLDLPADFKRGGLPRLYHDTPERLRRQARRKPDLPARYVWRGENRHGHGIFEPNQSGFPLTYPDERLRPADELEYFMLLKLKVRRL